MEQGHLLMYVDSTMRKPLSPGPVSGCGLWNFPFRLASASTQGPTPLLGEEIPGVCVGQSTALWSQSLLPPLAGFQGSKSFPQLARQAQTEPLHQPTSGFCLAVGVHAPRGAASQVAGLPVWGDSCLLGTGSRQVWVVCHLC